MIEIWIVMNNQLMLCLTHWKLYYAIGGWINNKLPYHSCAHLKLPYWKSSYCRKDHCWTGYLQQTILSLYCSTYFVDFYTKLLQFGILAKSVSLNTSWSQKVGGKSTAHWKFCTLFRIIKGILSNIIFSKKWTQIMVKPN